MLVDEALLLLDTVLTPEHLSDVLVLVVRQVWDGKTYQEIAQNNGYDTDYIKHIGAHLWKSLSHTLSQKVTKSGSVPEVLMGYNLYPEWCMAIIS
ncbi:MAG: hypothetical protein AAGD25_23635 [Cyanobacteria bacterium P01_F01_bin.150]